MSDSKSATESRRRFLKTAIIASSVTIAAGAMHKLFADEPHLTDADPTANAMDYVEDATKSKNKLYKPGSACANCQLYTGGATGYGSCQLFPGKLVSATGWCTSYTAKAS
jgi:High potential iron-sulfur protein